MDDNLDELLDSALSDFEARPAPPLPNVTIEKTNLYVDDVDYDDRPATTSKSTAPAASSSSSASKPTTSDADALLGISADEMKLFDEIFNDSKSKDTMKKLTETLGMFGAAASASPGDQKKLMEDFQKAMSELKMLDDDESDDNDDDDANANMDDAKLAEEARKLQQLFSPQNSSSKAPAAETAQTSKPKSDDTPTSTNPLHKVLDDLTKNSEKVLKNNNSSEGDFLSSLFGGGMGALARGGGGGEEGDDEMDTMMEPFMRMLFSKDILYPSLKLMLDNYDKHLAERRASGAGDEAEAKKLNEQRECITEMCALYESESDADTKEAKSDRLKRILELLEKCGVHILAFSFVFLID